MAHHEDTGQQDSPRHQNAAGQGPSPATGSPRVQGTGAARSPEPGRHRAPAPDDARPAAAERVRREVVPAGYESVVARLAGEFRQVHSPETVTRCVSAARHGAQDVTGSATPDQVERIARKHLQVLAVVAAERRQQGTLRNAAT